MAKNKSKKTKEINKVEAKADQVVRSEGDSLPETESNPAPKKDEPKQEDTKTQTKKPVYVWIRDINFGEHKPGETYKGNDHEALLAKKLIEKQ